MLAALGDRVELVLNDGQSRLGQPSTVVKVGAKKLEILRPGVVSEQTLKRLSSLMTVGLHGQHVPQPDGRSDVPQDDRRTTGLQAGAKWATMA